MSIQPTRLHCHLAFALGSGDIYGCCYQFRCSGTGMRCSKGDKLFSSAECRIRTWRSQDTYSAADWMPTHKPTELLRVKLKKNLELNSPSLWCLNQNVGSVIFIMVAFCDQCFEIILLIRNLLYYSQIWNPCTYNKIMKSGVILSIIYTSGQLYGIAHMLAAWVHI